MEEGNSLEKELLEAEKEHHHHHHDHEHDKECGCGHHHHDHEHDEECGCGHHHHDHEHDKECGCGHHHHDHEHDEECGCGHHHHDHEHNDECGCSHHHHDHEHGEGCGCGHDHGHHHADDVFTSWGAETPKKYSKEELDTILKTLSGTKEYGIILRAKGIIPSTDGTWINFDLVPGEYEVREGKPDYTGKLCVIGTNIDKKKIEELFNIA